MIRIKKGEINNESIEIIKGFKIDSNWIMDCGSYK